MKAIILVLLLTSTNGDFYVSQVGPFADRRQCAEVAVRLVDVARRLGIAADGACIETTEVK